MVIGFGLQITGRCSFKSRLVMRLSVLMPYGALPSTICNCLSLLKIKCIGTCIVMTLGVRSVTGLGSFFGRLCNLLNLIGLQAAFLLSRKYPRRKPGDEANPWSGAECVINCADEIPQTRSRRLPCAISYRAVRPIP